MKINQNISAVISNAQLHRSEDKLTTSIERLSSGYKINKSKDNPAGMAISNKMRAQIMALNQSSRNAEDGESVIQTAEGALTETHSMLQRMRELAVQAASDTMSTTDKQACQDEISALQEEIDRIATDTEFNGKTLLDGSQDLRIFPSVNDVNNGNSPELAGGYIRNFQTSDTVSPENYKLEITALPEQAKKDGVTIPRDGKDHDVTINGCTVEILATDDNEQVYAKLKEIGELGGVEVSKGTATGTYNLISVEYGLSAKISMQIDDTDAFTEVSGVDTELTLIRDTDLAANGQPYGEGFSKTATYLADGKRVTIRDLNGFEITFRVDPSLDSKGMMDAAMTANGKVEVNLEMTDIGSMTLQVGAHENQTIEMRIPEVTCESLYIDELNLVKKDGADQAIKLLDDAIAQVSNVRSRLGAYQNRLEYAVASLDGTEENMEAAISRIQDTDMAEEMSTYSNMNVLNQAGISVLAQANDMPQQILQLLQ